MTAVESMAAAAPAHLPIRERRLYRTAGFGSVLAAVAWLVQPLLVFVVAGADAPETPTMDYLLENPWGGPVEAAVFTGIGAGVLVLVLAVQALLAGRADAVSVPTRVTQLCGVIAGSAWILLAGWYMGPYTSVGKAITEAAPDVALQQAVLQIHNVGAIGIIVAAGLAFAGWLLGLATAGRTHALIGRPLAVGSGLAAAVIVVPLLTMPFSPPWGVLLGMEAYLLIAGVAFLVKARKA
ncbi:MAG: hypothetical protein GEU74_16710 [Nitriliruptorales bacterium]|nr:hypothetical protein [Nitriliruptorales bacterium]